MAQRLKIGLIYSYNKDWIAGSYYILNLIHALNRLPDAKKPELTILYYSEKEGEAIKITNYPYLKFHKLNERDFWPSYNLLEKIVNKVSRSIGRKNIIQKNWTSKRLKPKLDVLFPATDHIYFSLVKRLYWIPDFQEHFFEHFFSDAEVKQRKKYQKKLADSDCNIVFSSYNALDHFNEFYPGSHAKTSVLQFAVTHPAFAKLDTSQLFARYNIKRSYFFCANQVWAHKNHIVVLKALKILKEQKEDVLVVFSGKEYDHRNPGFFEGLKTFIKENNIGAMVNFLGFIEREDQLQLMNKSISVIQPSLFEGWSTVIEDAKAMNQCVIASALAVHKEQMQENVVYFDPSDENQLAGLLKEFSHTPPAKKTINYDQNVLKFGEQFIKIAGQIANQR